MTKQKAYNPAQVIVPALCLHRRMWRKTCHERVKVSTNAPFQKSIITEIHCFFNARITRPIPDHRVYMMGILWATPSRALDPHSTSLCFQSSSHLHTKHPSIDSKHIARRPTLRKFEWFHRFHRWYYCLAKIGEAKQMDPYIAKPSYCTSFSSKTRFSKTCNSCQQCSRNNAPTRW